MTKQSMPEKLRLIADCIEQGMEVEVRHVSNLWKHASASPDKTGDCIVLERMEYRAKPEKPRIYDENFNDLGHIEANCHPPGPLAIELTPEVRQALEDAGLI